MMLQEGWWSTSNSNQRRKTKRDKRPSEIVVLWFSREVQPLTALTAIQSHPVFSKGPTPLGSKFNCTTTCSPGRSSSKRVPKPICTYQASGRAGNHILVSITHETSPSPPSPPPATRAARTRSSRSSRSTTNNNNQQEQPQPRPTTNNNHIIINNNKKNGSDTDSPRHSFGSRDIGQMKPTGR